MKLNQAQIGKKIDIIVVIDGHRMNFSSMIRAVLDESLLIDPILEGEKTVGFSGHEAMAICVAEENKPYIWTGIEIRLVRYNGEVFHQLQTDAEGSFCNRRKYFRQYVGVEGMVNDLSNSFTVTIKDVSAKGCSFVTSEEFEVGQSVVVSFTDNDENFVLRALINRKLFIEETKRTVYGCEMRLENKKVDKYISERQRQDMQRRSASALDRKKD